MKIEFLAQLEEVKGKKDKGFRWVLYSGEGSLECAALALAIIQKDVSVNVTLELEGNFTFGGKRA